MKSCPICKQEHKFGEPCPDLESASQVTDPLIGRVLDGKYELEYLISTGGMASVYCARRRQIGDLVAVKVLTIDENLDPVDLKRFRLEASAAASIRHSNIVAVYDFGILDDIAYLVMERLEGPALSKEIRSCGALSLERALGIFKQVCAAVAAAHKQGVIHRDLKPSNIIFQNADCEEDLIKVVDFGIAKLIRNKGGEKLTAADFALGTPEYMSPEQCLGHKLDERSDIYSLGIVLYEMLTGEVPFYNPVASAILVQHAIETPRRLSSVNSNVPTEIDGMVMKALEKNREQRYRSALEMAAEFELACRSVAAAQRDEAITIIHTQGNGVHDSSHTQRKRTVSKREPLPFHTHVPSTTANAIGEGAANTDLHKRVRFSFERFIGRGEELKQLAEHFEQASAGLARTIFIIGDPGVGKTSLVTQFHQQLGNEKALFLTGKFYEYGGEGAYRPYLDGLHSFVRNFPGRNRMSKSRVKGITNKIKEGLDEVNGLISDKRLKASTIDEETKYRTFELLANIYVAISASIPLIFFLDDLQWADSLSLEFLAYLVRNTEKERIMVLGTVRNQELLDDTRPIRAWLRRISRYNGYAQIKLAALSGQEVHKMIESIFSNIQISESVIGRFYQVTQGNPFYLGEILRQLIQEQRICWTGDRWHCADIEQIELPGSILDIVELHLKRLTDDTVEVFTRAAVVGEKFSLQILATITELSQEALMDIIDVGLHEFIIKESTAAEPFADDYFVFYHGTLRKVLYERLSAYRRRRLHAQIGDKLESLHKRRPDRVAGELAYHFYHGANHAKTLQYGVMAGDTARKIFAVEEAQKYYGWADQYLGKLREANTVPEQQPEWLGNFHLAFGDVLMHLGKHDSAREQFEKGLKLSQQASLLPLEGRILRALGELAWSGGRYKEALEFCQSGFELLSIVEDIEGQCRLLGVIGNTYFSQGLFDQAVEFYQKSLETARKISDLASEGEALRHLGSIMGCRSQAKSALDYLQQALVIAREIGNRESERQVMMLIGNIYCEHGEPGRALEYYRDSLTIARAIGRRRGECRIALNMGEACRQRGDLLDAQNYYQEARMIAAEIEDRETEGHTLSNLGLLYQDLGALDQALVSFQQALSIFRELNYRSNVEAEALSGIANILWQQDQVSEAKKYFEMAVASGRELGLWHLVVPSLRCLAACERTLEQSEAALEKLKEALLALENMLSTNLSEQEQQHCDKIKAELIQELTELKADTAY
ncbi:MAG: tetratricopeptide repeat protein [Acidobacteriota bacterium]